MKQPGRFLRMLLHGGTAAAAILCVLLLVFDLYQPTHSDLYTARDVAPALPVLTGLAPDSLLNSGDTAELDMLPGIGEVLAARIIETRERDGLFFFPEDVMTVSGIGEKRFTDIMLFLAALEATATDLPPPP